MDWRWTWNLAAAGAVLLAVAAAALCIRSYRTSDGLVRWHDGRGYLLYSARGQLSVEVSIQRDLLDPDFFPKWTLLHDAAPAHAVGGLAADDPGRGWSFDVLGLAAVRSRGGISHPDPVTMTLYPARYGVGVPHLAVVAGLAAVAALAIRRCRRIGRWRSVRCGACGYDLRATPGRCPECGTMVGESLRGVSARPRTSRRARSA